MVVTHQRPVPVSGTEESAGPRETLLKFHEYRTWMDEQIRWLAGKWDKGNDCKKECVKEILELLQPAAAPSLTPRPLKELCSIIADELAAKGFHRDCGNYNQQVIENELETIAEIVELATNRPRRCGTRGGELENPIMKYFDFAHLPTELQGVSGDVYALACSMNAQLPDGPEKSAGLRKLLEAKDCFVRAALK